LINSIGIDDIKGKTTNNIEKFREFLNTLFAHNRVFFTVRNDGSYEIFNRYFPEFRKRILEIPDFGFFISDNVEVKNFKPRVDHKAIGFNIALDMPEIRYSELDYKSYLNAVASQIDRILDNTNYYIYLFAHIQSDYR